MYIQGSHGELQTEPDPKLRAQLRTLAPSPTSANLSLDSGQVEAQQDVDVERTVYREENYPGLPRGWGFSCLRKFQLKWTKLPLRGSGSYRTN